MNQNKSSYSLNILVSEKRKEAEQDDLWQIWINHQQFLFHRCLKWTGGNYQDAEEILSRGMLKLVSQSPISKNKITNWQAWLTRFMYHVAIDFHRERRQELSRRESLKEIYSLKNTASMLSQSPETCLLKQELSAILFHSIQSLPLPIREPFVLRFLHDMPSLNIAKRLGLSLESVYKRIKRAKSILQKLLQSYLSGNLRENIAYLSTAISLNMASAPPENCSSILNSLAVVSSVEKIDSPALKFQFQSLSRVGDHGLFLLRWL